jgi:nucleoid DNA-binding protein
MTKRDLVERIAQKTGLIQKDVTIVIQKLLDSLADEIATGHTVELRDFGVFDVVTRKSCKGRNPKHPEKTVIIPARTVVKFSTGKALKARVLQLDTARISGD